METSNPAETGEARAQYTAAAMDHFLHPRNAGIVDDPDGVGTYGDPNCGDYLEVTLRLQGETIADIKFRVSGCPGAISTSSAMTCIAKGKDIREALALTDDDVVAHLGGIPEGKRHCSLLGVEALRAAIADAILMRDLIRAGVLKDKAEYREQQKKLGFQAVLGHACDGSCGSEPPQGETE